MAKRAIILDYDGTMAYLFRNYDIDRLKDAMKALMTGLSLPYDRDGDPFDSFGIIRENLKGKERDDAIEKAHGILLSAEMEASSTCPEVEGFCTTLKALIAEGHPVAVATNNDPSAVRIFLRRCSLPQGIPVFGRIPMHTELMKPDPYIINEAAKALGVPVEEAVFIGDAPRDAEAAGNAGCIFLAIATRPYKMERMKECTSSERIAPSWETLRKILKNI